MEELDLFKGPKGLTVSHSHCKSIRLIDGQWGIQTE